HSCSARELAVHRVAPEEAGAECFVVPRPGRVENNGAARRSRKTGRVEIDDPRALWDRPEVRGSDRAVRRIVYESRAFLRHHEVYAPGSRGSWERGGCPDAFGQR